jgi:mono/diheme cytochrome c family protein
MTGKAFAIGLLLLTASLSQTHAQDPDAGNRLAKKWCVNCHVVAPGQDRGTSTGAPSFRDIAAQKSMTPMALRVFLQTPHHRMPDLHLSHDEIDDLSAYILSLRDKKEL